MNRDHSVIFEIASKYLFLTLLLTMMATPHLRSGVVAERSKPTSQEQWLHGCRSAEGSYSTFKVKKGDFVQGKEKRLCFAGASGKRYLMSKVRGT